MDMKRHMLILFKIFMLVDRKMEWSSYKIIVIRKGGRVLLLWKLIGKGGSYKERSYEIVRLENEVVIF
jgi:hypothetical protein